MVVVVVWRQWRKADFSQRTKALLVLKFPLCVQCWLASVSLLWKQGWHMLTHKLAGPLSSCTAYLDPRLIKTFSRTLSRDEMDQYFRAMVSLKLSLNLVCTVFHLFLNSATVLWLLVDKERKVLESFSPRNGKNDKPWREIWQWNALRTGESLSLRFYSLPAIAAIDKGGNQRGS